MSIFKSIFLIFIFIANTCWGSERILESKLNPGCGKFCEGKNITTFHLRAIGENDTLHYLWDFVERPSVLLAVTQKTSELQINWDIYLSNNKTNSIKFSQPPIYTFGVVIDKIIEFNDVNDTGLLDNIPDSHINIIHPEYFNWSPINNSINNNEFVELQMLGDNYHDKNKNIKKTGNLQLFLNGFCNMNHSDIMPHMLHSENSTQIDFILNHFEATFERSRFGVELLIVSQGNPHVPMAVDVKKSVDDEYSPGVIDVVEMKIPKRILSEMKGYLQWRPVSYLSFQRTLLHSTETVFYQIKNCSNLLDKKSILYAYYGDSTENLLIEKINVTIGAFDDGFYRKSNYSTWTFIVGYGSPPVEQFSNLVIMIIAIGMGLPILIFFVSAFYSCVRKFARPLPENNFTNFQ